MLSGIPWRDLLSYFGSWSAIYRRFNLWSKKDVLNELIGKSRSGNSIKVHLAVDSGGLPVYYELSCGDTHDIVHAESTADKGYN